MFNSLRNNLVAPSILCAAAVLLGAQAHAQTVHTLMPSPATVHVGNFNAALKPVLTVESAGDIVVLESAGRRDSTGSRRSIQAHRAAQRGARR